MQPAPHAVRKIRTDARYFPRDLTGVRIPFLRGETVDDMKSKRVLAVLLALIALLLSGCSEEPETLYRLPKLPGGYYELQRAIEQVLASGAEHISPASGFNRQAVQLTDIDGDGEAEGVAFFHFNETQPLRIYIFKKDGDRYKVAGVIKEDGEAVDSISYASLTGGGSNEIIVGLQAGKGALKAISVYSMSSGSPVELMSSDYSDYTVYDIDADGKNELMLIRHDTVGLTGVVEEYSYRDNALKLWSSAELSQGVSALKRVKSGYLTHHTPALYIAGLIDKDSILTDVLACRFGKLVNISLDASTHMSGETLRQYTVYATDIDGDGVLDLPQAEKLPPYESDARTGDFWKINWRSYSLSGETTYVLSTYHNFSDGWYFELPKAWEGNLTMTRRDTVSGERAMVFACLDAQKKAQDLLTIYTLTGDYREQRAKSDGRFIIYRRSDTIIAAKLWDTAPKDLALTREQVIAACKFIARDWLTGEQV